MKIWARRAIRGYARLISCNPFKVLLVTFIITLIAIMQAGNITTKSMDNEDMIPDDYDVKMAFDIIGNDFGGSDFILISIEIDNDAPGGIQDLRTPVVIDYINTLTLISEEIRVVESVNSLSKLLRADNDGRLPKSEVMIKKLVSENELYSNYISDDFSHSLIRLNLNSDYNDKEIVEELQRLIDGVQKPVPLKVQPSGMVAIGPVIEDELGPDMQRTSMFSIIGILLVLLLLFGSVRYALTPLAVIIAGIIWTYGYFGFAGYEITPATTGAMSMIMGIGIDFGIQTISRFRQELTRFNPNEAMAETLEKVFVPMFTTTMAALIGFRAMSMGDITVMKELGTMMSYGVAACFLTAITIVPAISVLGENFRIKRNLKKNIKSKKIQKQRRSKKMSQKNNFIISLLLIGIFGIGFMIPVSEASYTTETQMSQGTTTSSGNDFREIPFTNEVLMSQDPDPAEPGKTFDLRWKVTKSGEGVIENLTYNLKTEYPFSIYPGHSTVKNVGWWKGASGEDNHYILHYKLRVHEDASQEDYEIELQKRYDDDSVWQSKKYNIRVDEARDPNLVLGSIRTTPRSLQSGLDEVELNVELQNIGDDSAENVKISLDSPEGFTPSYTNSNEAMLGMIPNGQGKQGILYLDIDDKMEAGWYDFVVDLQYKKPDKNEYNVKEIPLSLYLKPKPEFEITSYDPVSFGAGDSGELRMKIKNIGGKKATSVSVHAFRDLAQPFEFNENSDYIGTLEAGQEGEAIVTFDVDSEALQKQHILEMEIRGVYNNQVIVEQKQVNLSVNERAGGNFPLEIALAVFAAIALIAFGIYFLLKNK